MTRKKHFPTSVASMEKTLIKFSQIKLPDTESFAEWNARSQAASIQAREMVNASDALDLGEFCVWLEAQEVDAVAVFRLIDLAAIKGRSAVATEAANAGWQKKNGHYFEQVRQAWVANLKEKNPIKKEKFAGEWSVKFEAEGFEVTAETILKSWLAGTPSVKTAKSAKKKKGPC